MSRNAELCTRFRGLGLHGRTSCPQRKNFVNFTFRDMKMGHDPGGNGILSTAAAAMVGTKLATNLLFGPVGAKVSNFLSKQFGRNPLARDQFPGEKHMVLPTEHGLTRANFAGPGTRLETRMQRGDQGVDGPRGIDAIAMRHDIDYTLARTAEDVRAADNRMIAAIKRSTAGSKTKAIVLAALKAKKLGEDIGVFNIDTFTNVTEQGQVRRGRKPRGAVTAAPRGVAPLPPDGDGAGHKRKRGQGPPELNPANRLLKTMRRKTAPRKKRRRQGGGPLLNIAKSVLTSGTAKRTGRRLFDTVILPLITSQLRAFLSKHIFRQGAGRRRRRRKRKRKR